MLASHDESASCCAVTTSRATRGPATSSPRRCCRSHARWRAATRGRGEPLDDLVQVACVGIMKAIDGFDLSRDVRFSSYATPTVLGEIKRHFRDKTWAMRVPRGMQELQIELAKARDELTTRARPLADGAGARRRGRAALRGGADRRSRARTRAARARSTSRRARTSRSPTRSAPATPSSAARRCGCCSTTRSGCCPSATARCCGCASARTSRRRRSPSASASLRCRSRGSSARRCVRLRSDIDRKTERIDAA